MKRSPANRRRPGCDDAVEYAPAVKLHHARAHQRMSRQGVAPGRAPLDGQDAHSGARQKQRRGGAGYASACDDDVVSWSEILSTDHASLLLSFISHAAVL